MIDVGLDIESLPVEETTAAPQTPPKPRPHVVVFLCTGEGEHDEKLDVTMLQTSPLWSAMERAILALPGLPAGTLKDFIEQIRGHHDSPYSPLLSTAISVLHAGLWRSWGYAPGLVLGHSSGEVAAACIAGVLSVDEAVRTAHQLGRAGAELSGGMLYVQLRKSELDAFAADNDASPIDVLCLAAVNSEATKPDEPEELVNVSLSGDEAALASYLEQHSAAKRLRIWRPWHHPAYNGTAGPAMVDVEAHGLAGGLTPTACAFVSATTASALTSFGAGHWQAWLTRKVQFSKACRAAAVLLQQRSAELPRVVWAEGAPSAVQPPSPPPRPMSEAAEESLYEKLGLVEEVAGFPRGFPRPDAADASPSVADGGKERVTAIAIEVGCQPSLLSHAATTLVASGVTLVAQAASMKRGMPPDDFINAQRARLEVLLGRDAAGGRRLVRSS